MKQKKFIYDIYHGKNQDISGKLSRIECIENHKVMVSINPTGFQDPINDKKSKVKIEIKENATFEDLNNQIEQMFTDIWFEY